MNSVIIIRTSFIDGSPELCPGVMVFPETWIWSVFDDKRMLFKTYIYAIYIVAKPNT